MLALEVHRVQKAIGTGQLKAAGRVTILARSPIVRFYWRLVTGNALVRDLALALVATVTLDLGITPLAEGIETQEQETSLTGLGCDYAQGFFYSKPITHILITQEHMFSKYHCPT